MNGGPATLARVYVDGSKERSPAGMVVEQEGPQ